MNARLTKYGGLFGGASMHIPEQHCVSLLQIPPLGSQSTLS
jgi:hypothetical protein